MTPVGPLPADLGQGGSGFHGEVAVRVRQLLQEHRTLVTNFNAMLAQLDTDAIGAPATTWVGDFGIAP